MHSKSSPNTLHMQLAAGWPGGLRGVALAVGVSQHQRACEKTSLTGQQEDKSLRNERENTLTRHKYV